MSAGWGGAFCDELRAPTPAPTQKKRKSSDATHPHPNGGKKLRRQGQRQQQRQQQQQTLGGRRGWCSADRDCNSCPEGDSGWCCANCKCLPGSFNTCACADGWSGVICQKPPPTTTAPPRVLTTAAAVTRTTAPPTVTMNPVHWKPDLCHYNHECRSSCETCVCKKNSVAGRRVCDCSGTAWSGMFCSVSTPTPAPTPHPHKFGSAAGAQRSVSLHSTKSLLDLLMEGKHFSPKGFHAFDKQLLSHLQTIDGDAATARTHRTRAPWSRERQEQAADHAASDFDSLFAKQYTIDHPGGSSDWDENGDGDGESWASAENAEERLTNRLQARERERSAWQSIHSHV